jgi:hypothetical protein
MSIIQRNDKQTAAVSPLFILNLRGLAVFLLRYALLTTSLSLQATAYPLIRSLESRIFSDDILSVTFPMIHRLYGRKSKSESFIIEMALIVSLTAWLIAAMKKCIGNRSNQTSTRNLRKTRRHGLDKPALLEKSQNDTRERSRTSRKERTILIHSDPKLTVLAMRRANW